MVAETRAEPANQASAGSSGVRPGGDSATDSRIGAGPHGRASVEHLRPARVAAGAVGVVVVVAVHGRQGCSEVNKVGPEVALRV